MDIGLSDWELTAAEGDSLSLQSIIKKLNKPGGLKRLTIKGIKEEQNLWDLRDGLVKEGGRFVLLDEIDRAVIDVVHKSCSQAAR
ncbi:hypothetical protein ABVK25_003776 [Lepraria finkii]|uniref:ATPase AAA-type core domain-containing protein n=1 Tax=Lepraria finkii TaxID=1340010 RepID=A0ABR4BF71_9LECA